MKSNLKKYSNQIIVAISIMVLFSACKTNKSLVSPKNNTKDVNIYVTGYEYNDSKFESSIEEMSDEVGMRHVAKLWKNGKDLPLENSEFYSDAKDVVVKNQDVYVVGNILPDEKHVSTMWKNGKTQKLTDGIKNGYTSSVRIEDNNVYVLGARYDLTNYIIKVWKNGISTDVIRSKNWVDASSMFIYKGDVFICGNERSGDRDEQRYNNKNVAKIWKNGKAQNLTDGHHSAFALSVYVENGIVYAAGYEIENDKYIAKLWIDGKVQNISDSSNNTFARSIFVSKGNVYIVGNETINGIEVAKLWINNKAQNLTNGKNHSLATAVFVHKKNVYVVGYEKNDIERHVAKLWINGEAQDLTDGTKNAWGNSVFVEDAR